MWGSETMANPPLAFAFGWTPCVGPVLGSVLTYTASATSSPWTGAGYLAIYGFGFAVASIAIGLAGIVWLDRKLERLEYETFMLQR